MEFSKILEAAKIPIIAIIAIYLVSTIITFIPVIGMLGGIISLLAFFVLNPILLGWAGFEGAKKFGGELVDGAIIGAFAGAASSLVNGIIGVVLLTLGMGVAGANIEGLEGAGVGAGIGLIAGLIGIIVSLVIFIVGGAICGAIGAFVGKKKK